MNMYKRIYKPFILIIIMSTLLTFLVLPGCARNESEGFAIYLTEDDISPSLIKSQNEIALTQQPLISLEEIEYYNEQTHELKVTPALYERITNLNVPIEGKTFIACVDRKQIYAGAFWTPVSSISFDGVTIWKPYKYQAPYIITLELGYPSPKFYGGNDPRNNSEIINSLQKASKLVDKLTLSDVESLPDSMKGYEIYSWIDKGEWHFDFITGTNRNKILNEIVYAEDYISEAGWVNIHCIGLSVLDIIFSKLPKGEEIFWLAEPRLEPADLDSINFVLPPETDINTIKSSATKYGLSLRASGN